MGDALDIQPARCDIGRDHDVDPAALEVGDRAFALRLHDIAVERRGGEAARLELLDELHRRLLGAREHQHRIEGFDLEQARQRIKLVDARHQPVALADVGGGRGLGADGDLARVAQMLLRDALDLRRQRGREQGDLPLGRHETQDLVDRIDEAHLQHLVGLVEHHEADRGKAQGLALQVVHHAPGRRHDHMDAATQRVQLRGVALAAVDRQHMQPGHPARVLLEGLGHLDGELARRHQHQGLRLAPRDIDAGEDRQRERRGLAGAGLRLTDEVATLEQRRDGLALDGRRRFVADGRERRDDLGGQAEVGEGDVWCFCHEVLPRP